VSADGKEQCATKTADAKCDPSACKDKAKMADAKCDPSACKDKSKTAFKMISTTELQDMIVKGSAVILDARSSKYDDGNRIPGAKTLNADCKAEDVAKIVSAKDAKIVAYCGSVQCPASKNLAQHLTGLGYTNVVVYEEGIKGWLAAGQKVETQTKTAVN
jgi:rhodanese-related sulfurtransferase